MPQSIVRLTFSFLSDLLNREHWRLKPNSSMQQKGMYMGAAIQCDLNGYIHNFILRKIHLLANIKEAVTVPLEFFARLSHKIFSLRFWLRYYNES